MAARLLRCTSLWGTSDWIEADPSIRHLREATYLPYSSEGAWGLFAHGARVSEYGRDPAPGEAPPDLAEAAEDGPFLYTGPIATHYGHFLVYTLPRLWPLASWSNSRQGPPRLLCHPPGPRRSWLGLDYVAAILGRLGRGPEDIVAFDRPVRLRDVVVPEPSLVEQTSMHALFARLCREIGRPFWEEAEVDREARPLYLSKTKLRAGVARIANEQAIVDELEDRGVEIVHPETLAFAEQIRLLSSRRIVMGSAGSAFHTVAFAAPGRRLVGLNWQPALNANFALLDRVNGASARYYCPHGARYGEAKGWELSWSVADPRGVAAALLQRAEWLDRGEPDDEGVLAEMRRRALRMARPFRGR